MNDEDLKKAEQIIGYTFRDKELLVTALTHKSYVNEHDNCTSYEKLEFLGDSVLNFVIAEKLYRQSENEGEMTQKRAVMVSRAPLCRSVTEMGLYNFVRFGNGTDKDEGLSVKTKSDIFESVLAAVYLDSGSIKQAAQFVENHLTLLPEALSTDYKSRLQEYAQANKISLVYPEPRRRGELNRPFFEAEAILDRKIKGFGVGRSKKEAQQAAAKQIYLSVAADADKSADDGIRR